MWGFIYPALTALYILIINVSALDRLLLQQGRDNKCTVGLHGQILGRRQKGDLECDLDYVGKVCRGVNSSGIFNGDNI